MSNFTIAMSRDEYLLFESCRQLAQIADIAEIDPDQAFVRILALPKVKGTGPLCEAVLLQVTRAMKVKKVAERLTIPWPTATEEA